MKFQHLIFATLATTIALVGCSQKETKPDDIKERQNLMQDWRGANESMKSMIERPESFDAATFKERIEFISNSQEQMWQHFAGEDKKGGKSKDTIWSDNAQWQAQVDQFSQTSANLLAKAGSATAASDIEQAYGEFASSCGSCHKAFKVD